MSTHTKGPWRIHAQAKTAVVGSTDFVVAACGGYSTNARDAGDVQDELEANARLIAMAPALLESLQNLVGLAKMGSAPLRDYKAALADADAAIKKATGAA